MRYARFLLAAYKISEIFLSVAPRRALRALAFKKGVHTKFDSARANRRVRGGRSPPYRRRVRAAYRRGSAYARGRYLICSTRSNRIADGLDLR